MVLGSGQYNQNDARLNLDHLASGALSISFGYHSRSDRNELYGDTFFDLINQAPDIDLLQPDPDGTPYAFQLDPEGRREPVVRARYGGHRRHRARTQGSIASKYSPFRWLTFDANLSYDRSDRRNDFFLDQGLKTEGFALGGLGEIEQTTGTTSATNASISANLLGYFRGFTLRRCALSESEDNEITKVRTSHPAFASLNNARTRFVSSSLEKVRSRGYFVSGGVDYNGRYIADLLLRRDGSSSSVPRAVELLLPIQRCLSIE